MAFAMALGPIPWILCSEIFPTSVRGRAMSVAKRQPVDWASKSILDLCFFQSGWPFVCVEQSTGNERPQPRRDRQILEILMYNPEVKFRKLMVRAWRSTVLRLDR